MRRSLLLTLAVVLAACGGSSSPAATATPSPHASADATPAATSARAPARRTIATGLHVPWGIAFLPDGDALVAERTTGKILRIPKGGGKPRLAMRVPGVNVNAGEGGLLGLAVSPAYATDKLVYAYFTTSSDNRIARFKLGGSLDPILTGLKFGAIHNGGRIAFGPDGKLYAGVGETGDSALAQDRGALNGKILRMNPDGSVPPGNPFPGSLVWSWGHRNVQGLAWDRSGRLWASEFGQNTFDEVNLIRKGRNYGWPVVEGKGSTQGATFTNPLVTWPTSQASPSGAAIVGSTLYVGALQGQCVWRIPLHGTGVGKPTKLLAGRYGRIRTVVAAPDGTLWVATSNRDGRGSPRPGDDRIIALRVSS
ncbi:PQQ-dependent sugar dehydrogenase [Candidatus Solirubrobacter pratensis]|uniref:PQQ-dependent sugar dehydrogenase n=1 Tax=Candidatus Solirubrobacter pratensis TaxID=1298857 RepID=UPI000414586C|nr:PQQ-dependent sugar dehydrogenase [Candidatus Solirubrobacter pratensis]